MQEYSSWHALRTGAWAKPDTQIPNLDKHRTETFFFFTPAALLQKEWSTCKVLILCCISLGKCKNTEERKILWRCVSPLWCDTVQEAESPAWLQQNQHNQGVKMLSGIISRTDGKPRIRGEKINWFVSDERWEALFWLRCRGEALPFPALSADGTAGLN